MSTYTVTIHAGPLNAAPTHTYVITDADAAPSEADPVVVLDDLAASWSFPDDAPWPSQLDGQTFTLRLLVDDLSELDDLDTGDAVHLRINSREVSGALLWDFTGLIGSMTATVVRRKAARKVLVTIVVIDPLTQLADVPITLSLPAQNQYARGRAIADAIQAALDADPTLAPAIMGVTWFGDTDVQCAPLDVSGARAYDVLVDHVRMLPANDYESGAYSVYALIQHDPAVQLGPFYVTGFPLVDLGVQSPDVPGRLALAAGQLSLTFPDDGHGIVMPADELVEDSLSFNALRYDAVSRVTVTTPDADTVKLSNGLTGRELAIAATVLSDPAYSATYDQDVPYRLAKAMLPRPYDVRWSAEGFVWRPSNARLAAMPHPFNPTQISSAFTAIVDAPVVILGLPAVVNPGSSHDYYGGTFSRLTLRMRREPGYSGCVITVEGKLARRIETRGSADPAAGDEFVTWDDIRANWPTVKTKTGANVLDPTMTNYELALARSM